MIQTSTMILLCFGKIEFIRRIKHLSEILAFVDLLNYVNSSDYLRKFPSVMLQPI